MAKDKEYKKYIYVGKPMPEGCPLGLVAELFCENGVYPQRWGESIGEVSETLGKKSYLKMDKDCDGKTMLDQLIECGAALSMTKYGARRVKTEDGYKWVDGAVTYYYLPYELEGATFRLPTAGEPISHAINVETDAVMEVLLTTGDEGWHRYLTIPIKTGWPSVSMFDVVEDLKETILEWAADKKNGFSFFEDEDDDEDEECAAMEVLFFDEMGAGSGLEFESVRDLMRCIVSIRLVNVQNKIIEKTKDRSSSEE